MTRIVPNPQALLEPLRRLVAPPAPARAEGPTSVDRILDAAHAAFATSGIAATTMTRIARDAGVSREWLYRRFANRDAVVVAVTQREVGRFIDGLAAHTAGATELDATMVDTFVYAVEFLRDHELLQRVVRTEPDAIAGGLLREGAPIIGVAVRAAAGYLTALAGLPDDRATAIAEVLVRLVAAITLAPTAALDLHDPDQLRAFAASVVPAVLASARPAPVEEARP